MVSILTPGPATLTLEVAQPDPSCRLSEGGFGGSEKRGIINTNKAFRKQHDLVQKVLCSAEKWGPRR